MIGSFGWPGRITLATVASVIVAADAIAGQRALSDPAIAAALSKISPSLVRIHVVTYDYEEGREIKREAAGSGTIISTEGHVLTNHHVAGRTRTLMCTLADREEIPADLVGTDPLSDIAVIKLRPPKPRSFPVARFGDVSRLKVGDPVMALGSPLALSQSVTMGIVSNTEMIMPGLFWPFNRMTLEGEDVGSIVRWIGHDAAIYGGNSGGPLVNMMRDDDLGIVRARAFGTFDFKITDPKLFLKEVAGSDQNFRLDEFADTMRSRIVSIFADALASAKVPVFDVASRYSELGEALLPLINPVVAAKYGLQITSFIIENVSVPPEVEQAIDKRSSMAAVGNLNDYVKFQMAQGMEKGGSSGGMATELAVGLSIAQQIMQQQGMPAAAPAAKATASAATLAAPATADLLSPADVAQALGVPEADVMTIIESGELAAKKIGASYRIKRSALDEYLAR